LQFRRGGSGGADIRQRAFWSFPLTKVQLKFDFVLLLALCFACSIGSAEVDQVGGARALCHVEKILRFGPHPPGSEAQKKVGAYIEETLDSLGLEVRSHTFRPVTPKGRMEMRNIWAVLKGKTANVILLAGHYDSKLFEKFRFVGANDGGSSTGLLLELARVLALHNPTGYSIWFAFFDGEEAIDRWTSADSLYGSREFVKLLKRSGQLNTLSAMILLDMVGGSDLVLRRESNSTDWLKDLIWNRAAEMGHGDVFQRAGRWIADDDHMPFLQEGIPAVDLIDMNYMTNGPWHSAEDTLDKLSARNLQIVGSVVLSSLPEIARSLSRR